MNSNKNMTFRNGPETRANACVGENGLPDIEDYSEGFSRGAMLLMDEVLADDIKHSVDILVYPICFAIRHSVELSLKQAVRDLERLSAYRFPIKKIDSTATHDLKNLWDYVKTISVTIDDRYQAVIDQVGPIIEDVADIDPNGQVFRYPYSLTNDKHLVDRAIINLAVLREQFVKLQDGLLRMGRLSADLTYEYQFGTQTKKLTRKQLFTFASEVLERDKWAEDEFVENKNHLKKRYGLSSKD